MHMVTYLLCRLAVDLITDPKSVAMPGVDLMSYRATYCFLIKKLRCIKFHPLSVFEKCVTVEFSCLKREPFPVFKLIRLQERLSAGKSWLGVRCAQ